MQLPSSEQLQQEIDQLNLEMSDPAVSQQVSRMKELAQELNAKRELLEHVTRYETVAKELQEVAEMTEGEQDEDMMTLAQEDAQHLAKERDALEGTIRKLLIPKDPRDSRDVIIEIRAGAGGEEAALFAHELYRAYARFAERQGWKMVIVNQSLSEQGGFKEVIAEVSGDGVFGMLKFERGVHRVQRIPETEKMGRVHTSTVTVAVLPQAEEVDIDIRPEDLRIDTYRASGAGGQHVNKTDSAVRITHVPTGTVVSCQEERSQYKNKAKAMSLLRSRLLAEQEEQRQQEEAGERRGQIGTGDRSEKIRTYNYPQDRITDHRIKQSWSNIPSVMEGNFDEIFADLKAAYEEELLNRSS